MLKVLDLFSGIGGFSLGLERTNGFETIAFCEIEPFCQKVLRKHWPDVPIFDDIRSLGKQKLEPLGRIDVVCGGFPCQPVSCAGKRKGDKDERWMWPEFYRIICEVKPRWVLVENVPGLLNADSGRLFAGILRDLASSWYDAEWNIVSAASVGAPHLRKRVFIVAHSNGWDAECGSSQRLGIRDEENCKGTNDNDSRSGEDVAHTMQQRTDGWQEDSTLSENRRESGFVGSELQRPSAHVDVGRNRCSGRNQKDEIADTSGKRLSQPQHEREHGGSITECDWWAVEPDVGRVASRLPPGVDGGRCAKRNVMAVIIGDGEWIGYNSCISPVDVCPRVGDEGYEKCKSICQQTNHAEINAILKAGNHAKGAMMVIYGHDHCCENCLDAMRNAGINKVVFADYNRVDRLRALGNAIVPQCAEFIGECVLNYEETTCTG